MAILVLMNLAVIVSSFLVTFKLLRLDSLLDSLACWFIFYFSQIVLTELCLGVFNALNLNNLIIFNFLMFLLVWLISRNKPGSCRLGGVRGNFTAVFNLKYLRFGLAVLAGFALVKISINLVNPPFGWDNLNYHFVFPVEWLKHGNLNVPITISDDPGPTYYPFNASLLFFWFIVPLKNVFLADLGQVPFFILAFLMIYRISRKIGVNKEFSYYAALLFILIPNVFKQLEVAYVDMMVATLFLTSLNSLFSLRDDFDLKHVLVFSASLGLFLGIKTLCLPYSALLLIPFIYLALKNSKKVFLVFPAIVIIAALGGFTYFRNLLQIGNPLYPLDLKLFGHRIFKGVVDSVTYRAHFKLADYSLMKLLFHEGLGGQSLIFVFPAVFLALPVAILKKAKRMDFSLAYLLILPILLYLEYRYLIPLVNTRYLYPLLGVGMITAIYTLNLLNCPRKVVRVLAVLCVFASMTELATHAELTAALILTGVLFFSFRPLWEYLIVKRCFRRPSVIFLIGVVLVSGLAFLNRDYDKFEYARYIKMQKYSGFWPDALKAWDWLNSNTKASNIAYVGRPVSLPLYGTNFKNNVSYVSVNSTEPSKLEYYPQSYYRWGHDFLSQHRSFEEPGNYRGNADYPVWLTNLSKKNIDYLFVYSLHQTEEIEFPLEDRWAKAHPDKFNLVFINETVHIYKIMI